MVDGVLQLSIYFKIPSFGDQFPENMIEDNRKVHSCAQSELTVELITQLEQDAKLIQLLEQRKTWI